MQEPYIRKQHASEIISIHNTYIQSEIFSEGWLVFLDLDAETPSARIDVHTE